MTSSDVCWVFVVLLVAFGTLVFAAGHKFRELRILRRLGEDGTASMTEDNTTPSASCIDESEKRADWLDDVVSKMCKSMLKCGFQLNKHNGEDSEQTWLKQMAFIVHSMLQAIDGERDQMTQLKCMYEDSREFNYSKLEKMIAEVKPKYDNLKCDDPINEVQHLKESLSEVEKEVTELSESYTREVEKNNLLTKQLNDSKKELQQKILALDAKSVSETLIVNEQTNAIKKAESLLATERKHHKATMGALQKRIKYAEELAESVQNDHLNDN